MSRAFDDRATVRHFEDALGAIPRLGPLDNINCPLGIDYRDLNTMWDYTLRFSWHGVVVQVASVSLYGCHDWTISTLGPTSPLWRPDLTGAAIDTVLLATGAPFPPHYMPQTRP